jgi:hypothetical protein
MPSNLAAMALSGRVMAAVPPNLAAMAEAGRGEPYLGHQAVLVADQAVANLCARRIDGGASVAVAVIRVAAATATTPLISLHMGHLHWFRPCRRLSAAWFSHR